jgi:hypothetical protein
MGNVPDRIKAARGALNKAVKDDLIPWLDDQGFRKTPFFTGPLGSYYAGNDFWTYYLARLDAPTEVTTLNLYVGPNPTVQFQYNRLLLRDPVDDISEAPGPSPDQDGALHTRHVRNRIDVYGRPRRWMGLHLTDRYAVRRRKAFEAEVSRILAMLKADLGDLSSLKAEWQASRTPVTLGPDGRVVAE